MNPIFRREFLARWRDWRSHLLLLGLALLLGLVSYLSYRTALGTVPMSYTFTSQSAAMETLATRASRAGHALFVALAIGNVAVWFLLAPLLCATGIARERERGLLEGLQLSPMSARSQVWARALSAMLYLFALQLVTLPIYFVAFSFGGVSEAEIGRAWLLVGAAAFCGVGLGLSLSAASHRPSGALFGAVALLCGWSFVAYLGWAGAQSPYGFLGLASGTSAAPLTFCQVLFYSHPLALVAQMLDSSVLRPPAMGGFVTGPSRTPTYIFPVYWTSLQVLPFAIFGWLVVGSAGLSRAARDVTRAFEPSGWAGRNPLVERWKKRRAARLEERRARASARTRVEGVLLADLPFDKWIHFKNPLLNREVKSRFRLRRTSAALWFVRGVLFLGAASAWIMAMTALTDSVGRASGATLVLWAEWLLGAALVGTWAASGYAREREAGTWEGLRLSLLGNGAIARTKWASPLLAFALLTLPLWALLPLFAPLGSWSGAPMCVLLAGGLVVAASLAFVSALGNWVSLRARNTTTATCWTLGLLLALFGAAPIAWESFGADDWCVRQITGVTALIAHDDPYSVNNGVRWSEDVLFRDRYESETGNTAPVLDWSNSAAGSAVGPVWRPEDQGRLYEEWCKAKEKQAARTHALLDAWTPLFLLNDFSPDDNSRQVRVWSENDYVGMALAHAVLCAVAIAFLVGSATRRLRVRLDQ